MRVCIKKNKHFIKSILERVKDKWHLIGYNKKKKLEILKTEYEKDKRNLTRCMNCTAKILIANTEIGSRTINQEINKLLAELEK